MCFKRCSCGREYSREEFNHLYRLPDWELPWGEVQELRNCLLCGSTIHVILIESEPEDEAAYKESYKTQAAQDKRSSSSPPPPV